MPSKFVITAMQIKLLWVCVQDCEKWKRNGNRHAMKIKRQFASYNSQTSGFYIFQIHNRLRNWYGMHFFIGLAQPHVFQQQLLTLLPPGTFNYYYLHKDLQVHNAFELPMYFQINHLPIQHFCADSAMPIGCMPHSIVGI